MVHSFFQNTIKRCTRNQFCDTDIPVHGGEGQTVKVMTSAEPQGIVIEQIPC